MAIHFHPLRVKEVRRETAECVSVAFEIPAPLEGAFRFISGQNVTVRNASGLDAIRRSYSICSSPFEGELRIAVKKVPGGIFSTFANERLQEGDVLEVLPPTGNFYTRIEAGQTKNYLFISAGSGITPVISLIKTVLETEKESTVTLLYGNRGFSSVIFREQLEALKDKYLHRFSFHHVFSREQTETAFNYGRIDSEKLRQLSRLTDFAAVDEFFICGPEGLIRMAKEYLMASGIDEGKIHFELFTTPSKSPYLASRINEAAPDEGSKVTMRIDGRSFSFYLGRESKSILDAGLDHGADLPFACKGGVCCTCKAKLVEGEVDMDANYGLEKSELKDGYILTCQSHPRSKVVVVDYDQAQ